MLDGLGFGPLSTLLWIPCFIAVMLWARLRLKIPRAILALADSLAKSPTLALITLLAAATVIHATPLSLFGAPLAWVHDEVSYLLAADTFAQGRLTNPTHKFWRHFEFISILQHPSFMSKYPPAQGFVLAIGRLLTGYEIGGVLISTVLACAALYWMLLGYFSSRWALVGAACAVSNFSLFVWTRGYWGGQVAAIGGALTVGALLRLLQKPSVLHALVCGAGISLLLNARPFEGALLGLSVGIVLVWHLTTSLRRGFSSRPLLAVVIAPISFVLILNMVWIGWYNFSITRDPMRMPYQAYTQTYDYVPIFIFQEMRAPTEQNQLFQAYHDTHLVKLRGHRASLDAMFSFLMSRLWAILFGFALSAPALLALLLGCREMVSSATSRALLLVFCFGCLGSMTCTYYWWHYTAGLLGIALVMITEGLRYLWNREQAFGFMRALVVATLLAQPLVIFVATLSGLKAPSSYQVASAERREIEQQLDEASGRHLVFVRVPIRPDNASAAAQDLRYFLTNKGHIDSARVVWAHDLGSAENSDLIKYYGDRRVWLLHDEGGRPRLTPYQ